MQNVLSLALSMIICVSSQTTPKVLLISFDGFRSDLLNETLVPNIYKWAKQSTWFTKGSQPTYFTYTAPNHMGIVTGLYQESHGIVSNYFYDEKTKQIFDYFNYTRSANETSRNSSWYHGEPIWLTNEKAGTSRHSAVLDWPMNDVSYPSEPHVPTIARAWNVNRNYSQLLEDSEEVVRLFTKSDKPSNFVAWYIAEPDQTLHKNGFNNGKLAKTLEKLDIIFEHLLKTLEKSSIRDEVNIILTSDHGHAEIVDYKHIMCLKDYLHGDGFVATDHMIYAKNEAIAEEIFLNLTTAVKNNAFEVELYRKKDLDENLHYKNSDKVGSIILEPAVGSSISFSCTADQLEKTYGPNGIMRFNASSHGMHPSNPEMRAILVMNGPSFHSNFKINEVPENIDLYPLLCKLLNLTPKPNNGSLDVIGKSLKAEESTNSFSVDIPREINYSVLADNIGFFIFIVPPTLLVLAFLAYGCKHTIMKNDPEWARASGGYRPLFTEGNDLLPSHNTQLGNESVTMSGLLAAEDSSEDEL
ncbi:unnamed protein product [Auanema sp. JU1783]|nr:unnamed protein product [Auanema sp. JU1783]